MRARAGDSPRSKIDWSTGRSHHLAGDVQQEYRVQVTRLDELAERRLDALLGNESGKAAL
jgi:hypothetical protein